MIATGRRTARSSAAPRSSASFPNEDAITRLMGAIRLEQNDGWTVRCSRYVTPETISQISDGEFVRQLTQMAGSFDNFACR